MDSDLYQLHLSAGLACGEERTCGKKQRYSDEEGAMKAAHAHNRWEARKHDVEPYPCAFCEGWHVGRVMSRSELEALANPSSSASNP